MIPIDREEERHQSLEKLKSTYTGSADDMANVRDALGDESWRIRKDAVEICARYAGGPIIAMLIEGLSSEDNAGMRNACQEALTRIGPDAAGLLVSSFPTADHDVRKFIIDIVGDIGSPDLCGFLIGALTDDDENVVIAACENLGKIRCLNAVKPLLGMLDPRRQWLSFVVIESLSQIGEPFDARELSRLWDIGQLRKPILDLLPLMGTQDTIEVLKKAFGDSSAYIQGNAAKNLYRLFDADPASLPLFMDTLGSAIRYAPHFDGLIEGRPDDEKTFALLGYIAATPEFFDALVERGGDEALEFFGSLSQIAPFRNPAIVTAAVDRYDDRKQAYIVYLCGMFGIGEAAPKLAPLCHSRYGHTRQALAFALGRIGGVAAVNCLFSLLDDPYPDVRGQVVASLAAHVSVDTFPEDIARDIFATASPEKIVSLVDLMGRTGFLKDEYLMQALRNQFPSVRAKVIEVIGNAGLRAFANEILLYLTDEDESVRLKAIEAIGRIGTPKEGAIISSFLQSDRLPLRKAAAEALFFISPDTLAEFEDAVFSAADPLFFLTVMDLFEKGAPLSPERIADTALGLDDAEISAELVALFLRSGFMEAARSFAGAFSAKRGSGWLPSHLAAEIAGA